jgi:hypothetical protein
MVEGGEHDPYFGDHMLGSDTNGGTEELILICEAKGLSFFRWTVDAATGAQDCLLLLGQHPSYSTFQPAPSGRQARELTSATATEAEQVDGYGHVHRHYCSGSGNKRLVPPPVPPQQSVTAGGASSPPVTRCLETDGYVSHAVALATGWLPARLSNIRLLCGDDRVTGTPCAVSVDVSRLCDRRGA